MKLRFSLKSKISIVVFLLVTGVLSCSAFLVLHYFESSLRENISEQQFTIVENIADGVDTNIRLAQDIILKTADKITPEIIADADLAQIFLDSHLGSISSLFDNGVFLFSKSGRLIAESPFLPERRGKDYSFREYFRKTVELDQPYISSPYFSSQAHGHPAINFTAPVRKPDGGLIGVLAGSLDLTRENLLGQLTTIKIGKTGYLYLYSTDRLMIMHPKAERILKQDVPLGANILYDRAIEGFEGSGETVNSKGLHALSSFKHLETVNWILAANYPAAEAYAPVQVARRYFAYGMAFLLLFSTLVAWFAMQKLIAPLEYFIGHIEGAVASPDTQKPLDVNTNDEIASLADAFIRLMHEIENQKNVSQQQLLFFNTLINTIPNPIYYKDLTGRYLGCNHAFEQLYDRGSEEIIGKSIEDIAPAEMAKILNEADAELFKKRSGEFQVFEHSLTYADGTKQESLFYKAVYDDIDGNPAGMVGTIIDITQRKAIEIELAEQHQFSDNLLKNSAVPCFVLDRNHKVINWTKACEELTGIAAKDVVGTDNHWKAFYSEKRECLADLIIDDNIAGTLDLYKSFTSSQLVSDGIQAESWFKMINGKTRYLRFDAAPIYDSSGTLTAAIETLYDLTGLKQIEQNLRESEQSYRSLIERSPDAIIVHRAGGIMFANYASVNLFLAQKPEELVKMKVLDLVHPDGRDLFHERITDVENNHNEKAYLEEKLLLLNGSTLDVETSSAPVFYGGEWAVQTILRDITERKELQERTWRQANYDALTGVPNRLMFLDRLQQSLEHADREENRVALLFIDLDHFKEINDTLGHEAGDALLRDVAKRLNDILRKTDTLARIGGDEFTVILPRVVNPQNVEIVVDRISKSLCTPFELPGGTRQISGSIGVAFYPDDGDDIVNVMKNADVAMYRSKEKGRNTFSYFTPPEALGDLEKPYA